LEGDLWTGSEVNQVNQATASTKPQSRGGGEYLRVERGDSGENRRKGEKIEGRKWGQKRGGSRGSEMPSPS